MNFSVAIPPLPIDFLQLRNFEERNADVMAGRKQGFSFPNQKEAVFLNLRNTSSAKSISYSV